MLFLSKFFRMKFSLGFSTCPNDTFMFDAMVHHKIDTEGLEFEVFMGDIEELNRKAFKDSIDITKLSYFAYTHVAKNYQLLNSGSALGYKNGPLLISKNKFHSNEMYGLKVAIPGKYTTANLLFQIEFPEARNRKEYIFSEIEGAVLNGEVNAGVIIHENRFTYEKKGLHKIIDLGESWEDKTGQAIPLGGIVVKRKLEPEIRKKIDRVLKRSVEFAFNNPGETMPFVKKYAQEMEDEVIRKHIELYVNDFSIALGAKGKLAINTLFDKAMEKGIITKLPQNIFVE